MNYMQTDIKRLIDSPQMAVEFTEDTLITIYYNLLCSTKFIHSCDIIHRDLKPSNILIDKGCCLQICDFGQAEISDANNNCSTTEIDDTEMTQPEEELEETQDITTEQKSKNRDF